MRPDRIYLKNFMNHSVSEIDCSSFQSVLIVGKTRDNDRISNGVGKTTIFRAIEYALFNKTEAASINDVVRFGKKKAIVEFDFELYGNKYRIYRHRTHTGAADVKLYLNNGKGWESICERTPSATDAKIKDLIKISHAAFTYSVLFRQADLTGLSDTKDSKERKKILKEPLNLSLYTNLEKIATEKTRPVKREIDRLESSIEVLGDPYGDIKKAKDELVSAQDSKKKVQESILRDQNSIDEYNKKIETLKSSLNQEDSDIHTKISEQENRVEELSMSVKKLGRKIDSLRDDQKDHESDIKKLTQQKVDLQNNLTELLQIKIPDLKALSKSLEKTREAETKGVALIAEAKAEMRMVKKSIPDSDHCPSCHQEITKEYRSKVEDEVNEKLKKTQEDLDFYESVLSKAKKKRASIELEIRAAEKHLKDIQSTESSIKPIEVKIEMKTKRLEQIVEELNETKDRIQEDDSKLNDASSHFKTLKETASQSNYADISNKIFSVKEDIKVCEKSINTHKSRLDSLVRSEGALNERIRSRTEDSKKLNDLKKELSDKRSSLTIQQMAIDAFSHRGIPTNIIHTVLDDLQFEISAALKELRPDLDVQIDVDLNFTYIRNGEPRYYSQLSYGQKVYIALAFKRGMSRVIQKKIGVDLRLLQFDEVDAHLDDAGIEAFADAIRKWQKEFKVFVITHNKELKDKFSNAILVEEGDDGATANLVTTW
jgi:DNA repair protein SbcC/Rad50